MSTPFSVARHSCGPTSVPAGVSLLAFVRNLSGRSALSPPQRLRRHQLLVAVLTFLAYTAYHMTRKPISVVESTLDPQIEYNGHLDIVSPPGWRPFYDGHEGGDEGKENLGLVDAAFLVSYAISMFFSGQIADRSNLRHFLAFGMLGCGLLSCLQGLAYFSNIHELWYFLFVQAVYGMYQATGWPAVVAVMSHWIPKGRRGLLMGIWNAHTSVGNILGAVVAGAVLRYGWGWSFIVPGLVIAFLGVLVAAFLVTAPDDVGLPPPEALLSPPVLMTEYHNAVFDEMELDGSASEQMSATAHLMRASGTDSETDDSDSEFLLADVSQASRGAKPISWTKALKIPGVLDYSLSLFFVKLVAYTFLYWLPYYIKFHPIDGEELSPAQSAYLSVLFDVGGIIGGIAAGAVADKLRQPALTAFAFLLVSIPSLLLYREFGSVSYGATVVFLLICGALVNAPYALITTVVSADLGTHESLKGNPYALATVTAIIDGTGSIGAAVGPFLAGAIPNWNHVFTVLMSSLGMAAVCLVGALFRERRMKHQRTAPATSANY